MENASTFDVDGIPVDSDTRVISTTVVNVFGLACAHQSWAFDGISAESLIFRAADVREMTDEELKSLVRESRFSGTRSSVTITRDSSGYSFVNFNFTC